MAVTSIVKLTLDGATYTLSSSPFVLMGYALVEAETGEVTVTESIRLHLNAGTVGQTQIYLRNLTDFFAVCRQRAVDGDTPGYVEVELATTSGFWRSPVLDGRLVYDEGALRYLGNGGVEVTLVLVRRAYWEGAEVEATSGLTSVDNYAEYGGASNRLTLGYGAVNGALPTPPRIEITNNNGSALNIGDIFVGANSWTSDLHETAHVIEAEDGSAGDVVDATCSGGKRLDKSLTGSYADMFGEGKTLFGRRCVAMLRLGTSVGTGVYARLLLEQLNGLAVLQEGSPVAINGQLVPLGSFVIPPALIGQSSVGQTLVVMQAKGSGTLRMDFLHLLPADYFLVLRMVRQTSTYGTADGDRIVWDGMEGQAWREEGVGLSATKQPLVTFQGGIMLIPGRTQHLYFLMRLMDKSHSISHTLGVRVYYRPRRLAL